MQTRVWSLGWEDPLEKGTAIHSSNLAWRIPWIPGLGRPRIPGWRIPWTEEPGELQSVGSQKVGDDWMTNTPTQGWNIKNHRIISACFQGKAFNIIVIHVYAPTTNVKEAEVEQFYEDLQDFLELTPKKDVLFITGDWNAKVGSEEIPGVTGKFGLGVQNEAGQRLTEFCQKNALVIANTFFQQHKRWFYTWTSPDGQYWNQIDYFLCSWRWIALYSQQKQDLELTVAQIMRSLLQNSALNWRK